MSRALRFRVLLVVVGTLAAACVPFHNLTADRDVDCQGTPDDLCLRVAEVAMMQLNVEELEQEVGPLPIVTVRAEPCPLIPNAVRCWTVEAIDEFGNGTGLSVVQQPNGSLVVEGTSELPRPLQLI